MNTTILPCGCVPGLFKCPEAVRLWADFIQTYEEEFKAGNFEEQLEANRIAMQNYLQHMGIIQERILRG